MGLAFNSGDDLWAPEDSTQFASIGIGVGVALDRNESEAPFAWIVQLLEERRRRQIQVVCAESGIAQLEKRIALVLDEVGQCRTHRLFIAESGEHAHTQAAGHGAT